MDEQIFKKLLGEALEPIKGQLGGIEGRLGSIEGRLDDPDTGLAGINIRLDDPDTGLVAINRRLDANTGAVVELERTVKGYADAYKVNKKNIERLDERLTVVEDQLEIQPSDQLAIHR